MWDVLIFQGWFNFLNIVKAKQTMSEGHAQPPGCQCETSATLMASILKGTNTSSLHGELTVNGNVEHLGWMPTCLPSYFENSTQRCGCWWLATFALALFCFSCVYERQCAHHTMSTHMVNDRPAWMERRGYKRAQISTFSFLPLSLVKEVPG